MAATKPAGPHPVLVVGFLAGLGFVAWAVYMPSVHLLWQLPLGVFLVVSCIGKMFAR